MKKMMMIMAMMTTIAVSAKAMTYSEARDEALFLTDKMAYELALSNEQYEAVYEINLDYMMSVAYNNLYGSYWTRRNTDLRYVLTAWQYDKYISAAYFYRPVAWSNNHFTFSIYRTYTDRTHFYRTRPAGFLTYKGGSRTTNYYARGNFNKPVHSGRMTNSQPNRPTVVTAKPNTRSITASQSGTASARNWRTNGTANHSGANSSVVARNNTGKTPTKGVFGGSKK